MLLPARLCLLALALAVVPTASGQAEKFEVIRVAEGVHAVVRQDPPGLMVDANSVFIINEEDVVVVDTSGAPSITRAVLAALRRLTPKPVRYVVNTHWHDDHIRGNQVYREAFPGVEFVAHARTREYLPITGASNRKKFLEGAPRTLDVLKGNVAKNRSLGGGVLTGEERESHLSDIGLAELVLSEGASAAAVLPTITVEERLTLHRGGRRIDVLHLGRGHTGGDLVVHLPAEGVLVAGDLVVWPVPFVGSEQSHIGEWSATLERLLALRPAAIIPGHGPVLRDGSYVRLAADLFASVRRQAAAAVARGETLEQARQSVDLGEFRRAFAGGSKMRGIIFSTYVAGPAVEAAYREASAKP